MVRLRRAIVLLCLLAASMPMLLPFALAARGSSGAQVQVLCTTHGTMWVVIESNADGSESSPESTRYTQGAGCPLCAVGAPAFAAAGPSVPPSADDASLTQQALDAPLTLSTRHPWRLLLSSRAPPLA